MRFFNFPTPLGCRLDRPLTLSEKIVSGHLDDPHGQDIDRGVSLDQMYVLRFYYSIVLILRIDSVIESVHSHYISTRPPTYQALYFKFFLLVFILWQLNSPPYSLYNTNPTRRPPSLARHRCESLGRSPRPTATLLWLWLGRIVSAGDLLLSPSKWSLILNPWYKQYMIKLKRSNNL